MTAKLVMFWIDERLKYQDNCTEGVILPSKELVDNLWKPMNIEDSEDSKKDSSENSPPQPQIQFNDPRQVYSFENIYWEKTFRWHMNGTIRHVASLKGQHESCPLNFRWFPFDVQICTFMIFKMSKTILKVCTIYLPK